MNGCRGKGNAAESLRPPLKSVYYRIVDLEFNRYVVGAPRNVIGLCFVSVRIICGVQMRRSGNLFSGFAALVDV